MVWVGCGCVQRELLTRFHVRYLRKNSETATLDAPRVASNADGSTPGHLVTATLPYHQIHMFSVRQVSGTGRQPRLAAVGASHYH
jgi:hypothetical protein